ncbi:hypothetical protein SAMN03159290_04832 [Pseudomonas sp. NFACC13-1]|nr:hypothetical protein SAMN03159290_04832 [Pseudomonas sp. NFACC13-1]
MTFKYSVFLKTRKTVLDQRICYALSPILGKNNQMLQIASAAVVSTHDATAEDGSDFSHEAHPGISFQVFRGRFTRVSVTEGDAWSTPHEVDDSIVIVHGHDTDIEH